MMRSSSQQFHRECDEHYYTISFLILPLNLPKSSTRDLHLYTVVTGVLAHCSPGQRGA